MAAIDLTSGSASAYGAGELQLQGKVQMTTALIKVTDNLNVSSPLRLSTTNVTSYGAGDVTSNTAFGDGALDSNTTGFSNTAFGGSALTTVTTGKGNTGIGYLALTANTGDYNTATGNGALYANTSGENNTGVGNAALFYNTTGTYNTGIGASALLTNTTGSNNTSVGYRALYANSTGAGNTAMGTNAMRLNSTGTGNSAYGYLALENNTNSNNTALGYRSLRANTSGNQNTGVAVDALLDNTTGIGNTALGYSTGLGITTGNYNTILGANVTGLGATLSNNIILADGQGNRRINVDSLGNVGIGTTTPLVKLDLNAAVSGAYTTSTSQVLLRILNVTNAGGINSSMISFQASTDNQGSNPVARIGVVGEGAGINDGAFVVQTRQPSGVFEQMRITSTGNVGIGTSSPVEKLDVFGRIRLVTADYGVQVLRTSDFFYSRLSAEGIDAYTNTNNAAPITFKTAGTEVGRFLAGGGLTFNGDTSAANALDDYEEGTFTATIAPNTSGTITANTSFTTWSYTKIGGQVTINGVFVISSVASPIGTNIVLGGLPFTIFNNNGAFGAFSVTYFTSATSANTVVAGRHAVGTTQMTIGVNASIVAANDEIYVTATYFV